jgi:hypothetical protein
MSAELENAKLLASLILSAEKPHYNTTSALRSLSPRSFGHNFEDLIEELMPTVISHKVGEAYEQHKALLELFLLNLVSVGFSHERLTIPTTPRKGEKIADRFGLDQRRTKRLVDALVSHGLMVREFTGNRNVRVANNYMPTEKLLIPYAQYLYLDHSDFDNYEPIRLNRKGYTGDIPWHLNLERDREILVRYNAFMSSHRWAKKDVTYRSFNDTPFAAGRVHTSYQTIVNRRIPIRRQTLLDGEPIAEPDFSANHLTLLSMIFDKPLPDSPYDMISDDTGLPKQTIKNVLVRLMGAKNEQGWSQAKFTLLKSEHQLSNRHSELIRDSFYKCIPFLREHNLLATGWGGKLQFLEGETAIRMFEWAVDKEIPIINVHDSFACKKQDEQQVLEMMHKKREESLSVVSSMGLNK